METIGEEQKKKKKIKIKMKNDPFPHHIFIRTQEVRINMNKTNYTYKMLRESINKSLNMDLLSITIIRKIRYQ